MTAARPEQERTSGLRHRTLESPLAAPVTPGRGAVVERHQPADLADILERVLNTGIVIAGEIRIDLLDIELLTIKLRLVITSLDRAEEVGLDWWRHDPWYSRRGALEAEDGANPASDSQNAAAGRAEPSGAQTDRVVEDTDEAGATGADRTSRSSDPAAPRAGQSVYAEEVVAMSASAATPTSPRSPRSRDSNSQDRPEKRAGTKKTAARKSAGKKAAAKKTAARKSAGKKAAGGTTSKQAATRKAKTSS